MTVIILSEAKKELEPKVDPTEEELQLLSLVEKNRLNQERVAKERKAKNEQVKRDYRLQEKGKKK